MASSTPSDLNSPQQTSQEEIQGKCVTCKQAGDQRCDGTKPVCNICVEEGWRCAFEAENITNLPRPAIIDPLPDCLKTLIDAWHVQHNENIRPDCMIPVGKKRDLYRLTQEPYTETRWYYKDAGMAFGERIQVAYGMYPKTGGGYVIVAWSDTRALMIIKYVRAPGYPSQVSTYAVWNGVNGYENTPRVFKVNKNYAMSSSMWSQE